MGLPIQSAPTYTCTLPFSGQEVKYRPFLVKEQKILVLAREGEDQRQIMDAVVKLIHNVTFEEVDAHKLAMVDLEYLFLQVRSVSVGETADITLSCGEEDCLVQDRLKLLSTKLRSKVSYLKRTSIC